MTKDEALTLALEALSKSDDFLFDWHENESDNEADAYAIASQLNEKAITAIKEALAQPEQKKCENCGEFGECCQAQPEQEPMGWITYESTRRLLQGGNIRGSVPIHAQKSATAEIPVYITPPQQERNFCSRCGKRLGINDWDVHTCTPPRGKEQDMSQCTSCGGICKKSGCERADYVPPKREWIGLTDEELLEAYESEQQGRWGDHVRGLRAVEETAHSINGDA